MFRQLDKLQNQHGNSLTMFEGLPQIKKGTNANTGLPTCTSATCRPQGRGCQAYRDVFTAFHRRACRQSSIRISTLTYKLAEWLQIK